MKTHPPRSWPVLIVLIGWLSLPLGVSAQVTRPETATKAAAPAPNAWQWNDLVNRPDRWPPQATLKQEVAFQDGTTFKAGTPLRVVKVTPRQIEVLLPDGGLVQLDVADTDVLEAANAYWATLTPAQREVTLAAIAKDRSLLPTFVTVYIPLTFGPDEKPPGSELLAADIVNQDLHVWSNADAPAMAISPMQSDLLFRARALAALPPEERVKAPWLTDYRAALTLAKEKDRKVFLFFTGSDWCGWCMRLEREVLRLPEFTDFAAEDLVLVKVDFPRRTRLPVAQAAENQRLAQQYGVRGYPTVVVLDAQGQRVGELGYQEGGARPFIARIKSM